MKIHIDIDCFFVSAARIVEPSLEGKAVGIGGRSDMKIFDIKTKTQTVDFKNSGNFVPTFYAEYEKKESKEISDIDAFRDSDGSIRGILTTSSYEARAYGVTTAMSIREALLLCPHLIIKMPNMSLYQELSYKLHNYLSLKIPLIEQASIDEFYGDLSGWIEENELEEFIKNLKDDILQELQLPVSIGAAPTKYIAKLATTQAKPFGVKYLLKKDLQEFISPIKIQKFAGIGKSMQKKLEESGIYTLGELVQRRERVESFGPYAKELYKRVAGENDAPIKTSHRRKSIGISRTFDAIYKRDELQRRVHTLARHLSFAIEKLAVIPTVFHLSIAYEMSMKSHKNISLAELFTEKKFDGLCQELFYKADVHKRLKVIRLSINCSSFTRDSKKELSLIGFEEDQKMCKLSHDLYKLRVKYGINSIKFASEMLI